MSCRLLTGLLLAAVWVLPPGPARAQATNTAAPKATAAAASAATAPATDAAPASGGTVKSVEINRAAKITLLEGDVRVLDGNRKRRSVALNDTINEGDFIVTGADGELHLDMEDGGYMAVRPNTKLRITKYQAKGEDGDTGVFGLLEGSFRSVSGWIGKYNRSNYLVRTPNATVGIRGTDHEPLVVPAGATGQEPGTYDKVNEGGSFIRTPAGRADVAPNQAGFVPHDAKTKPRVLADIPKIFKPTRNEHLLKGKHAAVQQAIDKRREGRRNEIKQKLAAAKPAPQTAQQRQLVLKEKREAAQKAREEARNAKQEEAKKKREEAKKKREEEEEEKKRAKGAHHAAHK